MDNIVAPWIRDLEILGRQLAAWLAPRMPQATDLMIGNLAYPSGAGMSHETILFDLSWTEGGRRLGQGLVVRVKPTANMVFPDDLFEQQFRVMRVLHERRLVPIAEPLWFEENASIIGAPFSWR